MTEKLVQSFLNIFAGIKNAPLGREITVFIISCLPILELRGGLLAASLLNMNPVWSFIICFIGNILPIPFILWGITPLFNRMKKWKIFRGMVNKLESKALSKKEQVSKYEFWGLVLFVGIPLPGTGAWTGCLIAALIGMDKKKATLAAILGVVLAGIIMMFVSFGILGNLIH